MCEKIKEENQLTDKYILDFFLGNHKHVEDLMLEVLINTFFEKNITKVLHHRAEIVILH